MWVEESGGQRINHARTEEAAETGAEIVAVACPFCMQMFEEGVGSVPQAAEKGMQVLDLAELLDMSMTYSKLPAAASADLPAEQPLASDEGSGAEPGD